MHKFHRLNKEIGELILKKYNYTCCKCGSINDVCVHHNIKMKPKDPNYNDETNLIVLCRSCHMSHHRKKGDIIPTNLFEKGTINNPGGRRGNNPVVYCKVDGCNIKQHGKGLCHKHYNYYLKYGKISNKES